MTTVPRHLTADEIFAAVSWADAVDALRDALAGGLDVTRQPARTAVPTEHGELLLMPAEHADRVGIKVLSVAPGNAALGRARIQATYILMDAVTLTPLLHLDGAALTILRTPALAAVAVDALAPASAHRLVVFGAGPQAEGHVHAFRAVRPIDDVRVVSRSVESASALVRRLRDQGIDSSVGRAEDVSTAEIVATATSSPTPVFDGRMLSDRAVVTAVGSHHVDRRELESGLMRRAAVVVEDAETAMREAGDVVMAVADGSLRQDSLLSLGALVIDEDHPSRAHRRSGPAVFKSVGQGWQDLVIAVSAENAHRAGPPAS